MKVGGLGSKASPVWRERERGSGERERKEGRGGGKKGEREGWRERGRDGKGAEKVLGIWLKW
jgi:hypothetical protein